MTEVKFYDSVPDEKLKFAVIVALSRGKLVYCRHRARDTWEIPGGHREPGEPIDETARRELYEETGALEFTLAPVSAYPVTAPDNFDGAETFGMLYRAEVAVFEGALHSEIAEIALLPGDPPGWTYPEIQPTLLEELRRRNLL